MKLCASYQKDAVQQNHNMSKQSELSEDLKEHIISECTAVKKDQKIWKGWSVPSSTVGLIVKKNSSSSGPQKNCLEKTSKIVLVLLGHRFIKEQ